MENIMACRVCLATDVKLYDMYKYKLVEQYQLFTGIQFPYPSDQHQMCPYCAALLLKSVMFRRRCLYAQELLDSAHSHGLLTTDYCRKLKTDPTLSLPYNLSNINYSTYTTEPLKNKIIYEEDENLMNTDEVSLTRPHSSLSFFNEELTKEEIEFGDEEMNTAVIEEINGHLSSDEEPLSEKARKKQKTIVKKKKKRHKNKENADIKIKNSISQDGGIELTDFDKTLTEDEKVGIDNEEQNPENSLKSKNSEETDNFLNSDEMENFLNDEFEIIILSTEEQIREIESRKTSRNYITSLYKCDLCYKGYMSDVTYNNHMLKHDPSSGPLPCSICHTRWRCGRALRAHRATHSRKYVCVRCAHVTRSSHAAREHIRWHDGHRYICKVCGATFSKSTSHLSHLRARHPSGRPCPVCGEFFLGRYGLSMHIKKAHHDMANMAANESDHMCSACNTQFTNALALETHLNEAKDGVCDTSMSPCILCGLNLLSDSALAQHIKERHTTDRPLHCHQCDRKFANARTYAVHQRQVHGGGVKLKRQGHAAGLVCETCGLVARTRATLVSHQRSHTGEKPYQCSDCPKRFAILQRLQMHRRTHTGERPFQCPRCPKAFKQKAALNRHDRVHSGVKPYSCRHCGKRFTQSNSAKLHERAVHLKAPCRGGGRDYVL